MFHDRLETSANVRTFHARGWAHTAKLRARVRVEMNRSSWIHVRKRCRYSGGTVAVDISLRTWFRREVEIGEITKYFLHP